MRRQDSISHNSRKAKQSGTQRRAQVKKRPTTRANFVTSNGMAKSATVSQIVGGARRSRLGYADFLYVCQWVRKKLGLTKPKKERKLPQLLSEEELKRFFRGIRA